MPWPAAQTCYWAGAAAWLERARVRPQGRYVARVTGLLTAPKVNAGIQGRWLSYLQQMDGGLAAKARRPRPRLHAAPPSLAHRERRHQEAEDGAPPCMQTAPPQLHLLLSSRLSPLCAAWLVARKESPLLTHGTPRHTRLLRECFPPGMRARSARGPRRRGTCTRTADGTARRPATLWF